jgi:hypothetical protein
MAKFYATFQTGIQPYNPWLTIGEGEKPNLLIPITLNDGDAVAVPRLRSRVQRLCYVDAAISRRKRRHSVMCAVDIQ